MSIGDGCRLDYDKRTHAGLRGPRLFCDPIGLELHTRWVGAKLGVSTPTARAPGEMSFSRHIRNRVRHEGQANST
jgi:hypothetical protein